MVATLVKPPTPALEVSMTTLKSLMIVGALLVGTASLTMAQAEVSSGPDGQLAASAGAADNPPAPRPGMSARAARHHGTRHHRMYMSVNRAHKGSKLTPASDAKPLSEWLHRP